MSSDRYIVIMAGGRGERFWPQSRLLTPKHLLPVVGDKPMIAQTLDRVKALAPADNIFVITNEEQVEGIQRTCPQLKKDHIIGEPIGRDTAAAVGLAMALVKNKNPRATFAMLPADAYIKNVNNFTKVLEAAFEAAEKQNELVTVGIKPTFPASGYGYINRGEVSYQCADQPIYKVKCFVEKPPVEKAKEYLASGDYDWNAGMFVWTVTAIEQAFSKYVPKLAACFSLISDELTQEKSLEAILADHYPSLEKISVDYAIMEKAENVVMIESTFDWDDVGSWLALERHSDPDTHGNVVRGSFVMEDCKDNIVVNHKGHLTAMLGVEGLVVVQTPDATLICPKEKADQIKGIVQKLAEDPLGRKVL